MKLYNQTYWKRYKAIVFETAKIEDIINYFEAEDFKKWLSQHENIMTKINPSLSYGQAHKIFYGAVLSEKKRGEEFLSHLAFKNFKKVFGKQIKFEEVN